MESYEHLSSLQLDTLRETGNIGAGHAASSLAKLLNKKIVMEVPEASIVSLNDVTERLGGAEQLVVSIFLRISGDVAGSMFFIVSVEEAEQLVQYLVGDTNVQNQLGFSALQETGNILAGSYLSSLADFTGLNLQPTPPALTIDMAGAVLASGLTEVSRFGDFAIMIETHFSEWGEIKGRFLLVPDPDSFAKIFRALGVPFHES